MKAFIKNTILLFIPLMILGGMLTSCEDDADVSGAPVIHYIRATDAEKSDSLLVAGRLGSVIAIVGENLGGARELWFNDQQAILNPAYVTNKSIIVSIPNKAPAEVTDQLKLKFTNGSELLYDFGVAISAPQVVAMKNEYAPVGSTTSITGDFFFSPISITFTGGAQAEIVSVSQTEVTFKVPEGAEPGPVTVKTNFGKAVSSFHYKDQRNIILNYDNLTAAGSWRPGPVKSEDGIDGNYLHLFGTLNASERIEDNFESQFWGNKRYSTPRNLVVGDPADLVMKFEARVKEWYGSYFQITWGPWENQGNQEVWSNLNARGLWRPWERDGKPFSTNGEWITVTIPLSEMQYTHGSDANGTWWKPGATFDKNVTGTLSFWVVGTPKADNSPVDIHIDNVRIVPRK